jgi:hypothetical protein
VSNERVIVADDAAGLGMMLGDLVRGNLAAHPDRARILDGARGHVNIRATDADVEVGLLFTGGELSIGSPFEKPDLSIACDSQTLLGLSSVPLRMGRPDVLKPEGRAVVAKMLKGTLKVRGMFAHAKLMSSLQRLLSVA